MKKAIALLLTLTLLTLALAACEGRTTTTTTTATEAPARNTVEPAATEGTGVAGTVEKAVDDVGNAVDDAVDTPAENAN